MLTMAQPPLTQLLIDLRANLGASDADIGINAIAEFLSLPRPDQVPRPGTAANWTRDDWAEWAKPFGLVHDDRTKHAHVLRHPDFAGLIIAKSSTSGDFRSGMALTTEVRRNVTKTLLVLVDCARALIDTRIRGDAWPRMDGAGDSPEEQARGLLRNPGMLAKLSEAVEKTRKFTFDPAQEDLLRILKNVEKEFDLSWRRQFENIGVSTDVAERTVTVIKAVGLDSHWGVDSRYYLRLLRDQLEGLRESERAERERKQAEREVKQAELAAKNEPSPQERFDQEQRKRRTITAAEMHAVGDVINAAQARLARAVQSLANAPLLPFPGPDAAQVATFTQKVAELESRANELDAEMVTTAMRLQTVDQLNAELTVENTAMQHLLDDVKDAQPWKQAYEDLVRFLDAATTDASFMGVANGIQQVKNLIPKATKALEDNRPFEVLPRKAGT